MPVQLPYLSSYKNVSLLFDKIASARIPETFNHQFLQDTIGLKSTSDRPLIPFLRNLGFIDTANKPTPKYSLLKGSGDQRRTAIAEGLRQAYRPLFDSDEKAWEHTGDKLRSLVSQVAGTDEDMSALIANTFAAVAKLGDFKSVAKEDQRRPKEGCQGKSRGRERGSWHWPEGKGLAHGISLQYPSRVAVQWHRRNLSQHLQRRSQDVPMSLDSTASLFVMLGQTAEKTITKIDTVVPKESLLISKEIDLATLAPDVVRKAVEASEPYKLFFAFETYLRDMIVEVLSKQGQLANWYEKVPKDVQDEITKLEAAEEMKSWMSLGSRDKSALMTLPQLLKVIDQNWKEGFDDLIRDKGLIQEARLLVHLRNTICHMSTIPVEELERIKQTMRDWFRVVAP